METEDASRQRDDDPTNLETSRLRSQDCERMNEMTVKVRDKLFAKAFLGVLDQRNVLSMKNGVCQYRGSDGHKCAIGHLIDDDKLAEAYDLNGYGTSVKILWDDMRRDVPNMTKHMSFEELMDLQKTHDRLCKQPIRCRRGEYYKNMKRIAEEYNFKFPTTRADAIMKKWKQIE